MTANGNITQLESPQNIEFISHGGFAEGYGVCDSTAGKAYFDYATNDSGNWNAPVRTQPGGANTFPLKIVRTTADGIWTLTQNFSRNPGERYAKITMTLKNNTAISRTASLVRYADVDAPFGATEFTNTFDFTFSAGLGFVRGNFGLAIQNGTPPAAHTAFVQNVSSVRIPVTRSLTYRQRRLRAMDRSASCFHSPYRRLRRRQSQLSIDRSNS